MNYDMAHSHYDELPVCEKCGTMYSSMPETERCRVCDDPRQFLAPTGHAWTTLAKMRGKYRNKFEAESLVGDSNIFTIQTVPKFAIGQRSFLIKTPQGNILWETVALLDNATVERINQEGGLAAILISHPHFYTTHAAWGQAFRCPVYMSSKDALWLNMPSDAPGLTRHLISEPRMQPLVGFEYIQCGGHFDGSSVLKWRDALFVADTILIVPAAQAPKPRPKGYTTFSFMWSIPNHLPLDPDSIEGIWKALKGVEFNRAYGVMDSMQVVDADGLQPRLLESIKISLRCSGWHDHRLVGESLS